MPDLFKSCFIPFLFLIIGVAIVFLWFNKHRLEGFENAEDGEDIYAFEMYYVDWCPHCVHAKPEFDKLGSIQTIGGKKVACKRIEAEKNPDQVRGKVRGYPTIRLYDPAGKMVDEYRGDRKEDGFLSFLKNALGV